MAVTEFEYKKPFVSRQDGFKCPALGISRSPDKQTFLDKALISIEIIGVASKRQPSEKMPEATVVPAREGTLEKVLIGVYEKIKEVRDIERRRKIAEEAFEIDV